MVSGLVGRSIRSLSAAALAALSATACVDPPEFQLGSVDAFMIDDPGATSRFHGDFATLAQVQLSTDSVRWTNVGLSFSVAPPAPTEPRPLLSGAPPVEILLKLQQNIPVQFVSQAALLGDTYRFARLILMPTIHNTSGIAPPVKAPPSVATITGTIGDTAVVVADTRFAFGQDLITDWRIDPVRIGEGDRVTITWDLNSEQWIDQQAIRTKRLDRALVAGKPTVRITVR